MENVDHPDHYTQYSIETIEITRNLPFDLGCAFKYVTRAPFKGKEKEDLEKALWYINDYIENPVDYIAGTEDIFWQQEVFEYAAQVDTPLRAVALLAIVHEPFSSAYYLVSELLKEVK